MRHVRVSGQVRACRGFTIFEMVVVICSIVILYMVAEQRLNELPAAAERANFYAVLEQIKTGVNFEMVTKLTAGHREQIFDMEGTNPMNYLIEPPSNYRGELEVVTDAVERRGAWYFETSSGELVYMVGGSSIEDVLVKVAGSSINFGQIRLKIRNYYSGRVDGSDTADNDGTWEGLLLAPVREYTWERRSERPIPLNQAP